MAGPYAQPGALPLHLNNVELGTRVKFLPVLLNTYVVVIGLKWGHDLKERLELDMMGRWEELVDMASTD